MSRFNTLMHGEPGAVADELCDQEADNSELRAALQNAMLRIERLEKQMRDVRLSVPAALVGVRS